MQTLYLPDTIPIDFVDKEDTLLRQGNILIGIHTFATVHNTIDLFPFMNDKNGHITIGKAL